MKQAVSAGCRAICITIGAHTLDRSSHVAAAVRPDWRKIDALREGIGVPVLLKGIMTQEDARAALERGIQGIIVSSGGVSGGRAPIEVLPSIVEVVRTKVPVLIDGSFRRGSDVVKALALGAQAVLLGRPPIWGLAAYGAAGVQGVLETLQTETARTMVNISKPTIKMLDRSVVTIHDRARPASA
jgi:isopentenyl diphosphate isomerase/L-lactate dehydrogenase-like FMN-dependent dehydrogenase